MIERAPGLRRYIDVVLTLSVLLAVLVVGFQYSYFGIFSQIHVWDDEGTMMLRVSEVLRHPQSPSAFAGVYGPFYYLHKYVIYSVLNAEVSHDINRWTTIVLWGTTALACALFVYRLTMSVVLATIVQMQLILHLRAFTSEPGHPHEIALVLIAGALLLSSWVSDRRSGLWSILGLGAAAGALLLVKVNLGAYFGASLALAGLLTLPGTWIVLVLRGLAAGVAVILPAAIMSRHLEQPWAWSYCVLATSTIAASILVSTRAGLSGALRWSHASAAGAGIVLAVAGVCAVLVGWGHSPLSLANSLFLRALDFPSQFMIPAPTGQPMVDWSEASLLVAFLYVVVAPWIARREIPGLLLALVKLAYGCFALYSLHDLGPGLLRESLTVPFLWLVLVRTDVAVADRHRFPRAFLCFLAAFQTLQAYPVHASQATWSVFLVAPVAAVCVGDALQTFFGSVTRRLSVDWGTGWRNWLSAGVTLLLLVGACTYYYREANIAGLSATYWKRTALDLPGASRLRLDELDVAQFRKLAQLVNANCDGFVGMPGFGSLYFWTRIEPPAPVSNAWVVSRNDEQQRVVIDKLESGERPCVIYNLGLINFWTGNKPVDPEMPLVSYINGRYRQVAEAGNYKLLVRNKPDPRENPLP